MDCVDRLTAPRIDRDIGQKKIEDVLGSQQSAISKYETRRANYGINGLTLLCLYYHVSAGYVLGLPEGLFYSKRRKPHR